MTLHIAANKGDFAKTVLMPGDPLRSKFIAGNFLEKAKMVNNVRGIHGYTGEYNGKRVSVMASGMGMPSMSIYAYELFTHFSVENIIRIGSAGALKDETPLRSVVISGESVTDSNIISRLGGQPFLPVPGDGELIERAALLAQSLGINAFKGTLYSSDLFYAEPGHNEMWAEKVTAVEMESAALYALARSLGKRALALCTVCDYALTGVGLTSVERETSLVEMIKLALELAAEI